MKHELQVKLFNCYFALKDIAGGSYEADEMIAIAKDALKNVRLPMQCDSAHALPVVEPETGSAAAETSGADSQPHPSRD